VRFPVTFSEVSHINAVATDLADQVSRGSDHVKWLCPSGL